VGIANFVKAKQPKTVHRFSGPPAMAEAHAAGKHGGSDKIVAGCAQCTVKKSVFGMAKFPIKKSVPAGTRPFGKRALPDTAIKQARAKKPRYGISKAIAKSQTCGSCKGKGCFTCKGSGKMTGNATAQNMGGGRTTLTGSRLLGTDKARTPAGHTRVAKSCGNCGIRPALDEKMPVCKACFAKSEGKPVKFGYESGTSKVERTGVRTLAGKATKRKMSPAELAEYKAKKSMTFVRVSGKAEMFIKSDYPCKSCKGFSGNALQLLAHKKQAHPLNTRIEAQQSVKKSMEFKLLDENDPDYHGHTGGGAGYNKTKWVHQHPAQASFDSNIGELAPVPAKTAHRHFKMGAWTTHHSPSGYREDVLGGVHENEMDAICALPNCGHPQSQHLPTDDDRGRIRALVRGGDGCVGCNDQRPRRNVRHSFRSA
jgi:hypothetical protein